MRVAEHAQQVAEVVVAAQAPALAQHLLVCLLHEVLRVLTRPGQCPRRAEQAVEVISEVRGVELAKRGLRDGDHESLTGPSAHTGLTQARTPRPSETFPP